MPDVKRCLDAIVAAGMLLALSPLFLAIAVCIRRDSPGPAFFRQTRIGRDLQPFWMLKFRSMVADAAARGPYFTDRGDPRITRVGRFLRRTSLDELPQLINVLHGDMSLVGPRPDVPEQMTLYTQEERRLRHRIRPGMTGWAQAVCRNEGTVEIRKALDLEYVRRMSLRFDIKILWLTIRQVLTRGSF